MSVAKTNRFDKPTSTLTRMADVPSASKRSPVPLRGLSAKPSRDSATPASSAATGANATGANAMVRCQQTGRELDRLVDQLKTTVRNAASASESFDKTERSVLATALELGRQAMELFVSLQGDGDLGEQLTTTGGKTLHRSPAPARTTVRSIFGQHHFGQYTYSPGRNRSIELRPVSARMSLPGRQWSYLLQEFSQMLSIDQAYDQAMKNLGQILGSRFSVDTAEQINGQMGVAAGGYMDDLPVPDRQSEGKLLVASCDCKGVPLVKEDAEKIAAFEQAKKNPGDRKMAAAASVYTVEPHVRTAEEVAAAMFRDEPVEDDDEQQARPKRPRPKNKNTTAHFPQTADDGTGKPFAISAIHVAMAWIIGQVAARRRANQVLVVLMDGQKSLWETFRLHLDFSARTVPVLDILHVLVYVWQAAGLFEKDDAARKAFTRARLLRILRDEVRGVIRSLRQLGSTRGLSGKALKDLRRICNYLENNADRMRYGEYLRRGYPIASGVIEGACRHLIKDRMERSGMRWTLEGARSMLNVRAAFQSDHWRSFLDCRIATETKRIHKHTDLLKDYTPLQLAC